MLRLDGMSAVNETVLFPNFLSQGIKQIPTGLRRHQIPVKILSGPSRHGRYF